MTRSLQGSLEKALGGSRIPLCRKPRIDRGARGIDGRDRVRRGAPSSRGENMKPGVGKGSRQHPRHSTLATNVSNLHSESGSNRASGRAGRGEAGKAARSRGSLNLQRTRGAMTGVRPDEVRTYGLARARNRNERFQSS
jgi:hypothetical protein